ncbi:MAG: MotA/TolQ/ExbB proton channel family protein [Nevskiales bacterium]
MTVPARSAQDLDALLQEVQRQQGASAQINREREARFLKDKSERERLYQEALAELRTVEGRIAGRRQQFEATQREIQRLAEELRGKAGDINQLASQVHEAAAKLGLQDQDSLLAAQFPQRAKFLNELAQSKSLPDIAALEKLWFMYQQAMTENGKVVRFTAPVMDEDGLTTDLPVTRAGPFAAVSEGRYLQWLPASGKFQALPRQPEGAGVAEEFEGATESPVPMLLDPSRGALLSVLSVRPSLTERVRSGGVIGYIVILLGVVGFVAAVWQLLYLHRTQRAVKSQLDNLTAPRTDNPLGRVLRAYDPRQDFDSEALEIKLNEAVLRETAPLERFQAMLRMIVAAGPLMGLLGTVVGMIVTFQVITEQGAGDPKLMAGGISIAMVTTVLGLLIAIPLLFINTFLSSRSRHLIQILDEQSAGLLARSIEVGHKRV